MINGAKKDPMGYISCISKKDQEGAKKLVRIILFTYMKTPFISEATIFCKVQYYSNNLQFFGLLLGNRWAKNALDPGNSDTKPLWLL